MTFIPDWTVLLTYSAVCGLLFVTPGPDMSLFLAKTIAGGRSSGFAAFSGASTGSLVHTLLAAIGLSALISASATAFLVLKVVGAVYLVWLAIEAIRSGSTIKFNDGNAIDNKSKNSALSMNKDGDKPELNPRQTARELRRTYVTGLFVNLSNPKIVLFFVTFLPQFIQPRDPDAAAKLLFLGFYFVAFTLPCGFVMIILAERFIQMVKSRPGIMRAIDWMFASVFCLFAIKILATERI